MRRMVVSDPTACRVLSNTLRRAILNTLTEGPKSATEIAEQMHIEHDAAADHLKTLLDSQLIQVHRMQRTGKKEPSFQAVAKEYKILFTYR